MSIFTWLFVAIALVCVGIWVCNKFCFGGVGEFLGIMLMIVGTMGAGFCIISSFADPAREKVSYIAPNCITKTDDGITTLSVGSEEKLTPFTSVAASIYLAPESNIYVRATQKWNAWGIEMVPDMEVVVKK